MNETALHITPSTPSGASGRQMGFVFLCHNSLDKTEVKRIADRLELETGTEFFLDAYSIPTGEAFLPWIEQSLSNASGVAIFLGRAGWGPTHLWEAERALARYREDPTFRLIPVALPGITAADMHRLGSGKVFQEINWADFREGPDDRDSLDKLAAALTGQALPQHRGPARLTPYQVRRDAERWNKSKRKDRSILYGGAQLRDARLLIAQNPDFVVLDQVTPFLDAAQEAEKSYWRRLSIIAGGVALALLILVVATFVAYRLAESRRLASLSRQLAITSREAPGADRELLIAREAVSTSHTTEGLGALFDGLQKWRFLKLLVHRSGPVDAAAYDAGASRLLIGTDDGHLRAIGSHDRRASEAGGVSTSPGALTAIVAGYGVQWVGRDDGRVEVVRPESTSRNLIEPEPTTAHRDGAIRSLARDASGRFMAAGTGAGRLVVVNVWDGTTKFELHEGESTRVTSLAFDATARWLVAGTSEGTAILIDTANWEVRDRYPKLEGGVLALGFSGQRILAITGYGALVALKAGQDGLERVSTQVLPGLLTSAAIDPTGARIALGDASGTVHVLDTDGQGISFEHLQAHANPVTALAFGSNQDALFSTSRDGMVAVWDLAGRSGPSHPIPALGPDASVLRQRSDGSLVAVDVLQGSAGVWRLVAGTWTQLLNPLDATRSALGAAALDASDDATPDPGFQSLDPEIPEIALDAHGARVAWSTRRGALLWRDLREGAETTIMDPGDGRTKGALALSSDGRDMAVLTDDGARISVFDLSHPDRKVTTVRLPAKGRALAFDASGSNIAVGLDDGRIALVSRDRRWKLGVVSAKVHDAAVAGVLFADSEGVLVSYGSGGGGADRTIVVTRVPSLSIVRRLQSRMAAGSASAISAGFLTDVLVAADHDGDVLIWRLSDLQYVASAKAGRSVLSSVLVEDGERRLVTYGSDGSFLEWDLDPEHWSALACEKANRTFNSEEWLELRPDDAYDPGCLGPVDDRTVKVRQEQ